MRKELSSQVEIDSPAEVVWSIITDFERFPDWNPFIRWIRGRLAPGSRLQVRIQPSGARGATFRPTLLAVEPMRELRWIGHVWMNGLFDGEHVLSIEKIDDSRVRFIQREVITGILVRVLAGYLDTDTLRGFREMNDALKARAEGRTKPGRWGFAAPDEESL